MATMTLCSDPGWLVIQLMYQLKEKEGVPLEQQCLIYAGKKLDPFRTVESYGIEKESTIHLVLRLRNDKTGTLSKMNDKNEYEDRKKQLKLYQSDKMSNPPTKQFMEEIQKNNKNLSKYEMDILMAHKLEEWQTHRTEYMNQLRFHIDVYEFALPIIVYSDAQKGRFKIKCTFNFDFTPYHPLDLSMKASVLSLLSFVLNGFSDDIINLIMDMIEFGFRTNICGQKPMIQIFSKSLCDQKFKRNIIPINYIKCKYDERILFYEWEWNKLANKLFGFKGKGNGPIAQEIELYHPYLIETHQYNKDNQIVTYKVVDIGALIKRFEIQWSI